MKATPLVVPPANQSQFYNYVKAPDAGLVNYNEPSAIAMCMAMIPTSDRSIR